MKLIDLCRYTMRQSCCDVGDYTSFLKDDDLNLKEVKQNGKVK